MIRVAFLVLVLAAVSGAVGIPDVPEGQVSVTIETSSEGHIETRTETRECPPDMTPVRENGTLQYCAVDNIDAGNDTPAPTDTDNTFDTDN